MKCKKSSHHITLTTPQLGEIHVSHKKQIELAWSYFSWSSETSTVSLYK